MGRIVLQDLPIAFAGFAVTAVRVLTNSREVAAFFETRHDNVLDARATSRSASRHFITPAKNRSIHQVVQAMAE
jgi:hypothetical protein